MQQRWLKGRALDINLKSTKKGKGRMLFSGGSIEKNLKNRKESIKRKKKK
jgi:hypothetical protein